MNFFWNAIAGRYIDERGRFVPMADVRYGLDVAIANTQAEIASAAARLQAGGSLDVWVAEMRGLVKDVNLYSAASAKGGWAQMTPSDYGRVGRAVRDQYAYLDRFAGDIADGYTLDGRFVSRARMYGQSGRPLYHQIERDEKEERGAVTESNIYDPAAENCDDCLAESALGRVKLGGLTPIGERECLSHCRCRIAYWDEDGDPV